jgi:hypothetical protein
MTKKDSDKILNEYAKVAIIHREASKTGDYKKANSAYEIIAGIYRKLRSEGIDSQKIILNLLSHSEIAVRCWAAAHALDFDPEKGIPVLESIAKDNGFFRTNAIYTLKEYRKGTLKFP